MLTFRVSRHPRTAAELPRQTGNAEYPDSYITGKRGLLSVL